MGYNTEIDYVNCINNLERRNVEKIIWNDFRWEFYILRDGKYSLSHTSSTLYDGISFTNNVYDPEHNDDDRKDSYRISFLESKIFNLIVYDPITSQWCIGDKDTNIFAAYDFDLRKCIDKLIG